MRFVRQFVLCAVVAFPFATALAGCSEEKPATATQSGPPPEIKQANDNMLKHMEEQKKK